jgi:uncharacterized protein
MKNTAIFTSCAMLLLLIQLASPVKIIAQTQNPEHYTGPIIDMHLHSYSDAEYPGTIPGPAEGTLSPASADEHMRATLAAMKKHNVVLGSVSGDFIEPTETWYQLEPDRILKAIAMGDPAGFMTPDQFEDMVQQKRIQVLGEVIAQYVGYSASDPVYTPYLKIAEKHGIPVAIHTGASFPGIHQMGYPKFRLSLGDPLLLEEMLAEFPALRVYMMHAGGQYYMNAIELMTMYPRVYTDISVLNWLPGWTADVLIDFLKEAKKRGILDRVMFGSDQMFWPQAIELAIANVNAFDFLTLNEKKGIFYDNAARFLRLSEEEIARHHGM